MTSVVLEHVPVSELPQAWRDKLGREMGSVINAHVTVRIEAESANQAQVPDAEFANDPLFGMWRDREDMTDVAKYIRAVRAGRFNQDEPRNVGQS